MNLAKEHQSHAPVAQVAPVAPVKPTLSIQKPVLSAVQKPVITRPLQEEDYESDEYDIASDGELFPQQQFVNALKGLKMAQDVMLISAHGPADEEDDVVFDELPDDFNCTGIVAQRLDSVIGAQVPIKECSPTVPGVPGVSTTAAAPEVSVVSTTSAEPAVPAVSRMKVTPKARLPSPSLESKIYADIARMDKENDGKKIKVQVKSRN